MVLQMATVYDCVEKRDIERCRVLLEEGHPIKEKVGGDQSTALHIAARNDDKAMVELLLLHGADPGWTDVYGQRPLDYTFTSMGTCYKILQPITPPKTGSPPRDFTMPGKQQYVYDPITDRSASIK
jgi:hypothetical protein